MPESRVVSPRGYAPAGRSIASLLRKTPSRTSSMSGQLPATQVDHLPSARRPLDRAASSHHTRIEREQASLKGYVQVLMERRTSAPDILLHVAPHHVESEWAGPTARLPARLRRPSEALLATEPIADPWRGGARTVLAPHEVHSVSVQIPPSNINHLHGSSLPANKTASSYSRGEGPGSQVTVLTAGGGSTRMERRRSVASMSAPSPAAPTPAWARRPRRNSTPDPPALLFLLGAASPETPPTRRAAVPPVCVLGTARTVRESPRASPWIGDLVCGASSGLLGPVHPSFRALAGCLKVTVRRHKFIAKSFPSLVPEATHLETVFCAISRMVLVTCLSDVAMPWWCLIRGRHPRMRRRLRGSATKNLCRPALKERCPPRQKSRVERLEAKVELMLT